MWRKLALLILPTLLWAESIEYSVRFIGLEDKKALETVKSASFLTTLKGKPPISINALRFRAESDIPDMIKALHAHGYYEATIQVRLEEEGDEIDVFVLIHPGPVYLLKEYKVEIFSEGKPLSCPSIQPDRIGIELSQPAIASEILDGEQNALALLGECGYPLATVENRQMIADYKTKTFSIALRVAAGPLCDFGPLSVAGTPHVKRKLFENKTSWKEGDTYDARLLEKTQKKLLDTGLFSSVVISHDTQLPPNHQLPIHIEASETKHKSINVGASYQTFFGPGLTFGWENRNVSGLGRRLSLQGDVTARTHTGTATFFVPDFWKIDQDYVVQAQALHESIYTYHQQSYHVTNRIERRIETKYRVSLGLKLERLLVTNSVENGAFSLLEIPLYFRWSSANHLLNPTKGATLEYKAIPSLNFTDTKRYYLYNSVSYTLYFPILRDELLILAQQIMVDSIFSRDLASIPVPKRILGGSDQELRGYRYHTVSPLEGHKPIGGRSGIFYTFETRFRLSKAIGLVPFFDMGSVYLTPVPKLHERWFKSVGVGLRYFTFLGPLRFDLAFPLDRRKHIDPVYRVLVSIGQTF